jgi:hypothetical protein
MTPAALLIEARRRGLRLEPRGDTLAVIPKRLLTPDFRDLLRAHKPALLAILTGEECSPSRRIGTPHRRLTERERVLLIRYCGRDDDAIIMEALRMFDGEIAG